METNTRTILSFEDFIKQGGELGQMGNEMPGFETEPVQDEIPTPAEEPTPDAEFGDETPAPAEMPTDDDSQNLPVHMMDDETGEATAKAPVVDANAIIEDEPKKD